MAPPTARTTPSTRIILVLMGVSGSGKTTIGTLLAERAGVVFADADDFHSPANKQKMAAGHPLTDDDRLPWYQILNALLRRWADAHTGGILACSALKESYRALLSTGIPANTLHFVLLELPREIIAQRMAGRHHEFMNPALLDSQLATLELPKDALRVMNDKPPEDVVQQILSQIQP